MTHKDAYMQACRYARNFIGYSVSYIESVLIANYTEELTIWECENIAKRYGSAE